MRKLAEDALREAEAMVEAQHRIIRKLASIERRFARHRHVLIGGPS